MKCQLLGSQNDMATIRLSKQKWNDLAEGMDHIMAEFALCMRKDESPDSTEAKSEAKRA